MTLVNSRTQRAINFRALKFIKQKNKTKKQNKTKQKQIKQKQKQDTTSKQLFNVFIEH